MKIDSFVTTYRSSDGKMHVYFYPGKDWTGHIISKFVFLSKDIDYLYTRHTDGAIDYIINNSPQKLSFTVTNTITGESKKYEVDTNDAKITNVL